MAREITDEILEHASNEALFAFLFDARKRRKFEERQEGRIIDELHKRLDGSTFSDYRLTTEHSPIALRIKESDK